MEQFFQEIAANGFDVSNFLMIALLFAAGSLILGFLGHMFFGVNSPVSNAVSSAIGILFIYIATVAVIIIGGELERFQQFLSPLPFVSIENEEVRLLLLAEASQAVLCQQVLSMVILAFLVNLLDTWLPRGEHVIIWFFWRCVTVVLSILAHWFITGVFNAYLPEVIAQNAPTILLGVLILMLAVGALKFVVGAAIAMVNPIIGALYTFFFANVIGQQLSKSVLSTALLTALVWGMNELGISVLSVSAAALMAYLPFLAVLLVVWYVCNRIL